MIELQLNSDIFRDDQNNQTKETKKQENIPKKNNILRRKFLYHLSAWDKQLQLCSVSSFDVTV